MNRTDWLFVIGACLWMLGAQAASNPWTYEEGEDDMTGRRYISASAPYQDATQTTHGRLVVNCWFGDRYDRMNVYFNFSYLNLTDMNYRGNTFAEGMASSLAPGTVFVMTRFGEAKPSTWWFQKGSDGKTLFADEHWKESFADLMSQYKTRIRLHYYGQGNVDLVVPAPDAANNPVRKVLDSCNTKARVKQRKKEERKKRKRRKRE